MAKEKFYKKGLKFGCIGCGNCCKIGDGYVHATREELESIAEYMNLSLEETIQTFVEQSIDEHTYELKSSSEGECIFLKDNRCIVYELRPLQCRTFPFWPENIKSFYRWKSLKEFCPGIDAGKLYSADEIIKIAKGQSEVNSENSGDSYEKKSITHL